MQEACCPGESPFVMSLAQRVGLFVFMTTQRWTTAWGRFFQPSTGAGKARYGWRLNLPHRPRPNAAAHPLCVLFPSRTLWSSSQATTVHLQRRAGTMRDAPAGSRAPKARHSRAVSGGGQHQAGRGPVQGCLLSLICYAVRPQLSFPRHSDARPRQVARTHPSRHRVQ